MAQQDYGAAQPIMDVFKNAKNKVQSVFGNSKQEPEKKVDTSYHDDMLKKANESFAKSAANSKQVSSQKPTTSKKAPPKSTAKKRLALKKQ